MILGLFNVFEQTPTLFFAKKNDKAIDKINLCGIINNDENKTQIKICYGRIKVEGDGSCRSRRFCVLKKLNI